MTTGNIFRDLQSDWLRATDVQFQVRMAIVETMALRDEGQRTINDARRSCSAIVELYRSSTAERQLLSAQ